MTAYVGSDGVRHYPHIRIGRSVVLCEWAGRDATVLVVRANKGPTRFEFCAACHLILRVITCEDRLSDESNRNFNPDWGMPRRFLKRGADFFFTPATSDDPNRITAKQFREEIDLRYHLPIAG